MPLQLLPLELIATIISFSPFLLLHKLLLLNKTINNNINLGYENYIEYLMHTLIVSNNMRFNKNTNAKVINSIKTIKIKDLISLRNIDLFLFKNLESLIINIDKIYVKKNIISNSKLNNNMIKSKNSKNSISSKYTLNNRHSLSIKNNITKLYSNSLLTISTLSHNNDIYKYMPVQIKNMTIITQIDNNLLLNFRCNKDHNFEKVKIINVSINKPISINAKYIIFDKNSVGLENKYICDNNKIDFLEVNIYHNFKIMPIENISKNIKTLKIIMHTNNIEEYYYYLQCKTEEEKKQCKVELNNDNILLLKDLLIKLSPIIEKIIINNHRFSPIIIANNFSEYANVSFK